MDPRNVTLEPEYYAETDVERYARVKPLLWLWEMFDKSPLGENVHLGVRLRRILDQGQTVALGEVASNVLLGRAVPLERIAGYRLPFHGATLIATYDPADALRGTD
jgi:hypothetical protein